MHVDCVAEGLPIRDRDVDGGPVLFVCTGNTCRSPLAAAAAETLGVTASSAGIEASAGRPASSGAAAAAERIGLDVSHHRSRPLGDGDVSAARLIFTMTAAQADAVVDRWPQAASKVARLDSSADIEDPYGGGPDVYDGTATHVVAAVEGRFGSRR